MTLAKYFDRFLIDIEPSKSTVKEISSIHNNLRDYLSHTEEYRGAYVESFLSGSYAKHTCIRPVRNDNKRDVDIDVVTNHTLDDKPIDVLTEVRDVLARKSIYQNVEIRGHSVKVSMSGLDVDIVPLIIDEESELFMIGSKDDNNWMLTNPKRHVTWSSEVNAENDGKYKPLVKLFKWWRRVNCPEDVRFPKGIAMEKIIADFIGDASLPMEDLFIETMIGIRDAYQPYVSDGLKPVFIDPALPSNDLFQGYELIDIQRFVDCLNDHLTLIDEYGKFNETWRIILGDCFPKEEESDYASRSERQKMIREYLNVPHKQNPQWSLPRNPSIPVRAKVTFPDGKTSMYENDGASMPKRTHIWFQAAYPIRSDMTVKWQVVNTGKEAQDAGQLRGGFEKSGNDGCSLMSRYESAAYAGKHYVRCFIIKKGGCIAYSDPFFINVA